jgi:hypothetical protein
MATFKKVKGKFKSKSIVKNGVHLGTLITKRDGGTFDIVETKHLNYLSKQFREIVAPNTKEYFEINPVNMKWEYIIKSGSNAIVFSEYGDDLEVYGYKDFDNDINPVFRQRLHLESKIVSISNQAIFYNCIGIFNNIIKQ